MKTLIIILIMGMVCLSTTTFAQWNGNFGMANNVGKGLQRGNKLFVEYEKFRTRNVSFPVQFSVGLSSEATVRVFSAGLQYGVRTYLKEGFFLEQGFGMGVASVHNNIACTKADNCKASGLTGNGLTILPSLNIVFGYNVSRYSHKQNLLWVKPLVYWEVGTHISTYPAPAIQLGFTHTFKEG